MSRKKVSGRMIAKRNRRYNKIAMIGITLVVCMMLVLLYVEGRSVQQRISANTQKQQELAEQIDDEKARTERDRSDAGLYTKRRIYGENCKRKNRSREGKRNYFKEAD